MPSIALLRPNARRFEDKRTLRQSSLKPSDILVSQRAFNQEKCPVKPLSVLAMERPNNTLPITRRQSFFIMTDFSPKINTVDIVSVPAKTESNFRPPGSLITLLGGGGTIHDDSVISLIVTCALLVVGICIDLSFQICLHHRRE